MNTTDLFTRIDGGLLGLLVGDALGVPVEFSSREQRLADPVTDMRAFGTHNQPAGTWSDDGSLALCTASSLIEAGLIWSTQPRSQPVVPAAPRQLRRGCADSR